MDYKSIESIKNNGFNGFKTIAELNYDNSVIPKKRGVYLVLIPTIEMPEFLSIGTGGFFKGRNPNIPVNQLKMKWVDDTRVIYIGKAGNLTGNATLYSRLNQYLRFGQGKNIGHWGGRLIWQIKDSSKLIICWKPVPNIDPREYEKQLLNDFISQYSKLPFANINN